MDQELSETILDYDSIIFILKTALKNKNENMRIAALTTLGAIGDPDTAGFIIPFLKDSSGEVRSKAVSTLGEIGNPLALDALIDLIRKEEDENIRFNALFSISKVGDESSLETLLAVVDDSETGEDLRNQMFIFLGRIAERAGDPIGFLEKIRESHPEGFERCFVLSDFMARMTPFDYMVELTKSNDPFIRQAAALKLCHSEDPRAIDLLLQLLDDDTPEVRMSAVHGFMQFNNWQHIGKIIGRIVALLNDNDKNVIITVLNLVSFITSAGWMYSFPSLGEDLKIPEVIDAVRIHLQSEASVLKLNAAQCLAGLGDSSGFDILIESLRENEKDNTNTITSLSTLGAKVVQPLLKLLEDENKNLIRAAGRALMQMTDDESGELFRKYLEDENEDDAIRFIAFNSLRSHCGFNEEALSQLLDEYAGDKSGAIRAEVISIRAGRNGGNSLPDPDNALKDDDPMVRKAALLSLIENYPEEKIVTENLNNPDWEIRRAAVEEAGSIRMKSLIPCLYEAMGDEHFEVAVAALNALISMGETEVIPRMMPLLNKLDRETFELLISKYSLNLEFKNPDVLKLLLNAAKIANEYSSYYILEALRNLGSEIKKLKA